MEHFARTSISIEELLEEFVLGALGLSLDAPIRALNELPASHRGSLQGSLGKQRDWAAWQTNRGPVSARANYDYVQSQRMRAHVLLIEWWISPNEHHKGWYYCYPKRTREWIKGPGDSTKFLPDETEH